MYPMTLKERLSAGEVILGTSMPGTNLDVAGAVYAVSPDFVWIDQEHTPYDVESAAAITILGRQAGVAPIIRVAWNDPALIKKAFDIGAVGVMIPQIDTRADAELAVRYSKYPPIGNRGVSPWWPIAAGLDFMTVAKTANAETVLLLQMESMTAYRNLDEIVKVPYFDVLFVGPLDLSFSAKVPGETQHPKIRKIMESMPKLLEGSGKVLGTTFSDQEECVRYIDMGYRFMSISDPVELGASVLRGRMEEIRAQHIKPD